MAFRLVVLLRLARLSSHPPPSKQSLGKTIKVRLLSITPIQAALSLCWHQSLFESNDDTKDACLTNSPSSSTAAAVVDAKNRAGSETIASPPVPISLSM